MMTKPNKSSAQSNDATCINIIQTMQVIPVTACNVFIFCLVYNTIKKYAVAINNKDKITSISSW